MEEPQNPYEPTEPEKVEKQGNAFLSCLYWLIMIPLAIIVLVVSCAGLSLFFPSW